MNKSHLAIIALSISAHSISWGMLTVSKIEPRATKKYFTRERIERDEERASEQSQVFLNSFGQHSLNKTGIMFCDLSIQAKKKTLPCLSHNQKLLVWCGAKGLEIPFLTQLFNGNEKVALIYSQKPIGEILEAYANAKEMMKWCPIFMKNGVKGVLKEEHYMMLKGSERILLANIDQKAMIHGADVPQFMKILKMLHDIDPETIGIGEIKGITDSIKLDLSLSERTRIFYSIIPQNTFLRACIIAGILSGGILIVGNPGRILIGKKCLSILDSIEYVGQVLVLGTPLVYGGSLCDINPQYQDHLKNNILPYRPTLTDYLKKNNFRI